MGIVRNQLSVILKQNRSQFSGGGIHSIPLPQKSPYVKKTKKKLAGLKLKNHLCGMKKNKTSKKYSRH
jgi:hypothetical protein